MMFAISMPMSVAMAMFVSVAVMSVVSSLAYLSGSLVWHILAYLFSYWVTTFYWYFKWDLSGDWVADLSWFIMTGRWSWDNL